MNATNRKLIGHMTCPDCDFPDAEIKRDKASHPYRYCPNCNMQSFTRGDAVRVKNMLGKMRPVNAELPAQTAQVAASAKKEFSMESL